MPVGKIIKKIINEMLINYMFLTIAKNINSKHKHVQLKQSTPKNQFIYILRLVLFLLKVPNATIDIAKIQKEILCLTNYILTIGVNFPLKLYTL